VSSFPFPFGLSLPTLFLLFFILVPIRIKILPADFSTLGGQEPPDLSAMASVNSISSEKDEDHDITQEDIIEDEEPEEPSSELDPSQREHLEHNQRLDEFLAPLCLDEAVLYKLARSFSDTYRHLALTSDQQFLPTPVTQLPTGEETGRYLAIDVGGSNLRVAFIELLGEVEAETHPVDASQRSQNTIRKAQRQRVKRTLERAWPIQEHLKMDKAEDLFAWIGDCIAEVVAESLTSDDTKKDIPAELDMGITFSFPIMSVSLLSPFLFFIIIIFLLL